MNGYDLVKKNIPVSVKLSLKCILTVVNMADPVSPRTATTPWKVQKDEQVAL